MEPIIRKPSEKEISEFPWEYDTQETCLILGED